MITFEGAIIVFSLTVIFAYLISFIIKLTLAKYFSILMAFVTPIHILAITIIIIIMILYATEAVDIGGFYYWIFTEMGTIARGY